MTDHHFSVEIAKECGVNASILFSNIAYWIEHNRANGINYHDGHYWTFNSMKAFSELFPYFSEKQIKTALKKLEDDELIMTGNYNKLPFDRTKWYAITSKGYSILNNIDELNVPIDETKKSNENGPESPMRLDQKDRAIPDINEDKKLNIENIKKERKEDKKKQTSYDEIINNMVFNEEVKAELLEFVKMRKFIKKPLTNKGLELIINELFNLSYIPEEQIMILDKSIANNWAGIFPLTNYQERQQEVKRDGSDYAEFDY